MHLIKQSEEGSIDMSRVHLNHDAMVGSQREIFSDKKR